MNIQTLVVGSMKTNCYIAGDLIIDPGDDPEYIISHVTAKPRAIIATHGHFDHIMGARAIQLAFGIPFYIRDEDVFLLSRMQDSAKHFLGISQVDPPPIPSSIPKSFPFIQTPGHTPGSISLVFDRSLIVGDTLFAGGMVGRTDHTYSRPLELSASIEKIRSYGVGTRVLPGHGDAFVL